MIQCIKKSTQLVPLVITSSGAKKGDLFLADVNTQLKNKNVTTDIKVDTNSNLFTTITVDEAAPGLKTILSFRVPDQRSGKLEAQYLHDYAGICTSVGLTANPIVNFSGVVGTNILALGTDVSFDTKTGDLTKCNAGLSFTNADLVASLNLNNKGDNMCASYYHSQPSHNVKSRINNFGKASALLQHEWCPKSLFTVSGEVDTKSVDKGAKFGLALALKP
ncbi:hypothetical protein K7X08_017531 [Anisodus acutangulus]|uniref:Uncharacterized protein n=1 Tax=Anisodus acutangulus TaxID=402998 RepID=A0A9Q1R7Z7_9SOLA|nr:hypothetical protein K7X08_017531 [Anisodus acutangulus]